MLGMSFGTGVTGLMLEDYGVAAAFIGTIAEVEQRGDLRLRITATAWDHSFDMTGKRVAVIGTGSTGVSCLKSTGVKLVQSPSRFSDQFSATAGLRYTREKKSYNRCSRIRPA